MKLWAKGVVEKNTVFEGSENTQYYIRKAGQLMYGKLDFLNCAFGIVPPELDGYESTLDAPAFDISNIDSTFLLNKIIQRNFYKKNGDIANGSRKAKRIHPDTFLEMEIAFPELREQTKIAGFITCLNTRIEKQCRLTELLKSYKRGVLSKLFPQKGETTPQYRFAGFTEPWERRTLGEIGKAQSGVGFPNAEQGGTIGIPFFKVSDMNLIGNEHEMYQAKNYVSEAQICANKWNPVTALPAIFFAKVGAAVMLNRKRLCRSPFLLDNNTMAYSLNENEWDVDFAKALFDTIDLTSLVQVGALPSYNTGDIECMKIYLPSVEEQRIIGEFFQNLDTLITVQQKDLDIIQTLKSGLLQQLFI